MDLAVGTMAGMALREPLDPGRVVVVTPWRIEAVSETESTNLDLLQAAARGAPEGIVRVADFQSGGRGRLDRVWSSPPGAGLTFSMLLRPLVPMPSWGWLPLVAGLALAETIGYEARLKWPNDLLLGQSRRKAAGILVQSGDGVAVVGIGINVSTTTEELPVPTATSLWAEGITDRLDREALLGDLLGRFGAHYQAWQAAAGDAELSGVAAGYRAACQTIGQRVSVQAPGGELIGDAVGIDSDGRLVVRPDGATDAIAVAAGDVTHLRAISR
jgi:BirA family biotin operon repressor/biotin-[acetyl-CoA-carboxylase] ligase